MTRTASGAASGEALTEHPAAIGEKYDRRPAPAAVYLTRNGLVESVHRATVCITDSSGEVIYGLGDTDEPVFMRSSAKPLQALAVILSGAAERFRLTPAELAVVCGSHGGEDFHVTAVRSILEKAGLGPEHLQCGAHAPLDEDSAYRLRTRGDAPTALHNNCSGKHAGMLAAARALNASVDDYLDLSHPVQRLILEIVAEFSGVEPGQVQCGVDGCTAPVHALPLKAASRAYARLLEPRGLGEDLRRAARTVTEAMRRHPEMVAASRRRLDTELMRVDSQGLISKAGAEGFYAAAWRRPRDGAALGLALKMEDGIQRGRDPLVIRLMQEFGALSAELPAELNARAAGPLRNHRGLVVGEVVVRL